MSQTKNAPVEYLSSVDHLRVQSGTTPRCLGSKSRLTRAPVYWLNTFHAWPIHVSNPEQLCFQGFTSWSTIAPVHPSNTSLAWTIHICNPEQLLVFRALPSWSTKLFRVPTQGQSMYAFRNNSLFLGLF